MRFLAAKKRQLKRTGNSKIYLMKVKVALISLSLFVLQKDANARQMAHSGLRSKILINKPLFFA